MNYQPFFEVHLHHSYYTRGRCSDFTLAPSIDGQELADKHRLIVKQLPDRVMVFVPVDDAQTPLIQFPAGATMVFQLRQRNRDVQLFTDLDEHTHMAAPLYSNAGITPGEGGSLFLIDQPGSSLERGVFADVEIHDLDAITPGTTPLAFNISLAAKRARWAYYIVTNIHPGSFALIDNDPRDDASSLRFDDSNNPRDLAANPDPADPIAVDLAELYPTMRRLRFVTRDAIPFHEQPRQHLELHLDGLRRAGALPNPVFDHYSRVEMTIGKTRQALPSLFRIIKDIIQPFSPN